MLKNLDVSDVPVDAFGDANPDDLIDDLDDGGRQAVDVLPSFSCYAK